MQRIAIIGAGIGGLATALAVPASDYEVDIFERSAIIKGLGSGLTLWPNATHVLRVLGVLKECETLSAPLLNSFVKLSTGRTLLKVPTGVFPTPAIAMHRADLHRFLVAKLSHQNVFVSHKCIGIRWANEGSYLRFEDNEKGPYDLIIASDGMQSKLRDTVLNKYQLRSKGYRIWRGVVDLGSLSVPKGDFFEIWGPKIRFGILPMSETQVCWYAARNQDRGDVSSLDAQKQSILDDLKGWDFPASDLVKRTPLDSFIPSDVFDLKFKGPWNRDRVLLLGDAVHPMPANLGLGGNMALEDALLLGKLLEKYKGRDLSLVSASFEKLRSKRVRRIVRSSNRIGFICQLENPILRALRNFLCHFIPGWLFTWNSKWTYKYRADKMD